MCGVLEELADAVVAHFEAAVRACTSSLQAPNDCVMECMHTIGKPRGVGDELCVWYELVDANVRDHRPVVRRYTIGVQVLRTGYPQIDAETLKPSQEDIELVTPFFSALGEGLLRGLREFGEAFQCDPALVSMRPQGPEGGQAGWRMLFTALNPRVPSSG